MAKGVFSRLGNPVRIPVSTNDAKWTPPEGAIPDNSDLYYVFVNPCPFDVRLEGFPEGAEFKDVGDTNGMLVLARSTIGPFASRKPICYSTKAVAAPGQTLPSTFTGCFLEIQYGRVD